MIRGVERSDMIIAPIFSVIFDEKFHDGIKKDINSDNFHVKKEFIYNSIDYMRVTRKYICFG